MDLGDVLGELDSGFDMSGVMMSSVTAGGGGGGGMVVELGEEQKRLSIPKRRQIGGGGGGGVDIWFGGTLKSMLYFSDLSFVSVLSNLKFHPLHRRRISSGHERGKRLYLFISFYSFFFFSGSVFYFKKSGRLSL